MRFGTQKKLRAAARGLAQNKSVRNDLATTLTDLLSQHAQQEARALPAPTLTRLLSYTTTVDV